MSEREREPPQPTAEHEAAPEAPASEAEQRAARELAGGIAALLAGDAGGGSARDDGDGVADAAGVRALFDGHGPGRETAGAVDDLLATAQMISAAHRERQLPRAVRHALIDEALVQSQHRESRRRWPALVAAAAVLLAVGAALLVGRRAWRGSAGGGRPPASVAATADRQRPLAPQLRSRPSSDLLGRPIRERAGASRRLDRVFADRMAGYRRVVLARAGGVR